MKISKFAYLLSISITLLLNCNIKGKMFCLCKDNQESPIPSEYPKNMNVVYACNDICKDHGGYQSHVWKD